MKHTRVPTSGAVLLVIALVLVAGKSARAPQPAPNHTLKFQPYGRLAAPTLVESSGLFASRRHPGVYWTHNDSKRAPDLFAIDERGRSLGVHSVRGAANIDWEDIAINDSGQLVIADVGDNDHVRSLVRLIVVDEPEDPRDAPPLPVRAVHPFIYPDGPRNAEALIILNDACIIIEKRGQPDAGLILPATAYRVPLGGDLNAPPQAVAIGRHRFNGPVTAADLSPDGRRLVVATYLAVYVFDRPDPDGPIFQGTPSVTLIACRQMEAIAFMSDGSADLLLTNEQRTVYRLTQQWFRSGRPFIPGAVFQPTTQPANQQRNPKVTQSR